MEKLWIQNNEADRKMMLIQASENHKGMVLPAIEKDWWVMVTLKALFRCSCSESLLFKGGTSLSKGFGIIDRFSEDIDLAISHSFFGIDKTTKSQKEKLRKTIERIGGTMPEDLPSVESIKLVEKKQKQIEKANQKLIDSKNKIEICQLKNYLVIFFLLSWMPVYAQVSIEDYLSDFDYGVRTVEKIYSGFDIKVTSETRPSYEHVRDSVRSAIADGASNFEDAFGVYLAWFRDFHLHDYCGAQDKFMTGPVDYSAYMEYSPQDMFAKVDDKTFLIRYTSSVWSAQRKRWVKKAIRMYRKSHCENLILDLRGNKGGAAGTSDAFIELLYDHDGYYNGVVIRNTPANIDYFRRTMKLDKYWQKHLDASELSTEEYPILFEPHIVHYENVSAMPGKAAVIIDNNTASAAEEFILILQRVSNRVTLFGKENSLGCLDFANAGTVTLPKSGYKFRVPLTCSLGLPETGIDANGIAPDVTIECAYPKTLTNNIDDFVLWVASWLTKH